MTPDFIRHCVHVVGMDQWTEDGTEEEEDMQYVIVAAWLAGSFVL